MQVEQTKVVCLKGLRPFFKDRPLYLLLRNTRNFNGFSRVHAGNKHLAGARCRSRALESGRAPYAEYTLEKKKAGRDETHLGLLCDHAHAQTLTGEQSRKVSLGFQGGDRNTPF